MSLLMKLPITLIDEEGAPQKVMAVIYKDRPTDHEPIEPEAAWASNTVDME